MATSLSYNRIFPDDVWGSTFKEVTSASGTGNVFICHVSVSDIEKIAQELSNKVTDQSWITDLDDRARRAYENTAHRTAQALVSFFQVNQSDDNGISSEFGEIMVSVGSSKALETIFGHRSIPIAELWKPKVTQNEGFDFHTVCPGEIINFGEAKYSGSSSPYGGGSGETSGAGGQADGFIGNKKHLMDNVHLVSLAGETAANNLDQDHFGIVLAFSVNAQNPLLVFQHALENTAIYANLQAARNIYLVGVSYDHSAS